MNYFNPYYYSLPVSYIQPKVGLLGKLFGKTGITISNFLNGTQRVLNIANQTIPIVKQVKPLINNTKTMFKVMNEFKRAEKPMQNNINNTDEKFSNIEIEDTTENISKDEGPIFFI